MASRCLSARIARLCMVCAALALFIVAGCENTMRDMYRQPKYKPLAKSAAFDDRRSARPPPTGTIAYAAGASAGTSSGRLGTQEAAADVPLPYPLTASGTPLATSGPGALASQPALTYTLLARGRERYDIFCAPCHSPVGDGDGIVARRGFPHPPSYHTDKLRNAPDSHFYEVITHGYGAMYPYASRVEPADRWAIIGYIRALQLSQHAPVRLLTAAERARLAAMDTR